MNGRCGNSHCCVETGPHRVISPQDAKCTTHPHTCVVLQRFIKFWGETWAVLVWVLSKRFTLTQYYYCFISLCLSLTRDNDQLFQRNQSVSVLAYQGWLNYGTHANVGHSFLSPAAHTRAEPFQLFQNQDKNAVSRPWKTERPRPRTAKQLAIVSRVLNKYFPFFYFLKVIV